MEPYNVIKAERAENGIVTHTIATENGERNIRYHDIRAGLSWPTEAAPGYYCILGEEYQESHRYEGIDRRGELTLLSENEFQGISLNELFDRLTDDTASLNVGLSIPTPKMTFQGLRGELLGVLLQGGSQGRESHTGPLCR